MPTSIGYQDLAALIARQPAVTERWRAHVRSSTISTIHATFSFPRPVGSSIPDPYFTQLAALDPRALDVTGSIPLPAPIEPQVAAPIYDFPVVQRRLKGDRLPLANTPPPPASPEKEPSSLPPKLKDQASLTPDPKPVPQPFDPAMDPVAESEPSAMPAPKGDRAAPSLEMPAPAAAEKPVPTQPEPLPAPKAAKPATKTKTARKAAPPSQAPATKKPVVSAEVAPPTPEGSQPPLEIATQPVLETAAPKPLVQATQTAPEIIARRDPSTEIADLESQRADIRGSLVLPPVPVAEAPKVEPAPEAPAVAESSPAHKQVDRFQVVDSLAQYSAPQSTRIFFGTREIGFGKGSLQRWEPDEVPTVLAPPHVDPEIKRAALDPEPENNNETPGVTVAPKGEVTGEGRRPRTPAERLSLVGETRVKHEKCLSNAIYFEARGEVERGQMAVAQVILNRAFSGYYPGNVCDVVYQNAHRHLACQFTFACDNVRDVVKDQKAWALATRVASEALDGKFWLPEVGKATHYHATYVNPWWVRTMTKHSKLGIHIFYRPKRWGDGEEIPVWGDRLDVTGTVTPMGPAEDQEIPGKRAAAQPPKLRSIFDPVEEIKPGG